MSILTDDYRRIENANVGQNGLVNEYKTLFANNNIDGAQSLVNADAPYIIMDANKLNDLVDTINYMQQFWTNDKEQFANWYMDMTKPLDVYKPENSYCTGCIVLYNGLPFFCIANNTTGAWDSSKWVLLKPDETGLNFIGEIDSTTTYSLNDFGYIVESDVIQWKYYDGSNFVNVAQTYPNIRYLADETQSINGEVYITDYGNGGV